MPFYAFSLDSLNVKNPRGKLPDNDTVTFSVFVNQVERGRAAGEFPDLAAGSLVPAGDVVPRTRGGMSWGAWIIGPLEIAPGDAINLVYSCTNTSDSQLSDQDQEKLELKILDTITTAAVGAVAGSVGSAVAGVLGFIGDPVGKFLGWSSQGPCNGIIFSDTAPFSGAGLDALSFHPPVGVVGAPSIPEGDASQFSFTRAYTDEPTHDSSVCGQIAHYEITFSAVHVPFVSVYFYLRQLFPRNFIPSKGLRPLAPAGATVSVRRLLGLRP